MKNRYMYKYIQIDTYVYKFFPKILLKIAIFALTNVFIYICTNICTYESQVVENRLY